MNEESKCPICGGTGWILRKDEEDRPIAEERCSCFLKRETEDRLQKSGLSAVIAQKTFDSFRAVEPWQKELKSSAEEYVAAVLSGGKPWLFLCGQSGSGKSHLCSAVVGRLIKAGHQVRYMQWLQDSRVLKYAESPDVEQFKTAEVLYVDDLFKGIHKPTDADIRLIFEIINYRYNNNLPTIISCESFMQELLQVDEATFSRVIEKTGTKFLLSVERDQERNYRYREGCRI